MTERTAMSDTRDKQLIREVVKAAVELAIVRHNLTQYDGDVNMSLVAEDAARAVSGIDTCAEEPTSEYMALESELTALRSQLATVTREREEARKECMNLKLSTASDVWWDDDTRYDSPETFAEEFGMKIGDEFQLQGARYRDEKFRVTKVSDCASDDWKCEEITPRSPLDFEPWWSMKRRADSAEQQLATLQAGRDEARQSISGDGIRDLPTHFWKWSFEMQRGWLWKRCVALQQLSDLAKNDGWVISDGNAKKFRTWDGGIPDWTDDPHKALRMARREDAEAIAAEDEDAWGIHRLSELAARALAGKE